MTIGELDRKITIEQYSEVRDAQFGSYSKTWATFLTAWAKKEDTGGDEDEEIKRETARRSTRWTLRYVSGVTEKMRVVYGGDAYNIREIKEEGRRRWIVLETELADNE